MWCRRSRARKGRSRERRRVSRRRPRFAASHRSSRARRRARLHPSLSLRRTPLRAARRARPSPAWERSVASSIPTVSRPGHSCTRKMVSSPSSRSSWASELGRAMKRPARRRCSQKPAIDLTEGQRVALRAGTWARIVGSTSLAERATVYNFEVANYHVLRGRAGRLRPQLVSAGSAGCGTSGAARVRQPIACVPCGQAGSRHPALTATRFRRAGADDGQVW